MAKYKRQIVQRSFGSVVTTKSWFGSHADMVVDSFDLEDDFTSLKDGEVVCKDDIGYYVTDINRLDSGLADPNRYSIER